MDSDQFPHFRGSMEYVCVNCGKRYAADQLLYTCPDCDGVFLLEDANFSELQKTSGDQWRTIFDQRKASQLQALQGVFRFYELVAPIFEQQDIIYLGEANTPLIPASPHLATHTGIDFAFKNEGQNPSASFKDRGMACAFSCLKWLCRIHNWDEVLTICASTGDTSAAAALYASYIGAPLKSVVILPEGKVTPQQLSQPLGSGATVIELPGVFDDCMKTVEILATNYRVALLNSKNPWRLLGQESYAFEVCQWLRWDVAKACLFVPIGNAGNISAIMAGLLKLRKLGVIGQLPKIFGVQSEHADPVFRYYDAPPQERVWHPVKVSPSVAQAAMIGNPVSFPRVKMLASRYVEDGGADAFHVVQVKEQEIMDAMLLANRNGHIACTQGGECLAGMLQAQKLGLLPPDCRVILDSTAHALKFMDFQNRYFGGTLDAAYEVIPDPALVNKPQRIFKNDARKNLDQTAFANLAADAIAQKLQLQRRTNENN